MNLESTADQRLEPNARGNDVAPAFVRKKSTAECGADVFERFLFDQGDIADVAWLERPMTGVPSVAVTFNPITGNRAQRLASAHRLAGARAGEERDDAAGYRRSSVESLGQSLGAPAAIVTFAKSPKMNGATPSANAPTGPT